MIRALRRFTLGSLNKVPAWRRSPVPEPEETLQNAIAENAIEKS